MANLNTRIVTSSSEFNTLQERFGFLPEHDMDYPRKGAIISHPPEEKVGVPILIFEAGLRLPTTDFFEEIMRQYGFHVDGLTSNPVNMIVGFELVFQALGVLPQLWAFKAFFNSSTQSGV